MQLNALLRLTLATTYVAEESIGMRIIAYFNEHSRYPVPAVSDELLSKRYLFTSLKYRCLKSCTVSR